jgi:hypothetical protein
MECALKYHIIAPEREAYQKSTHFQNVSNHSSITRHFYDEREYDAEYCLTTTEVVNISSSTGAGNRAM